MGITEIMDVYYRFEAADIEYRDLAPDELHRGARVVKRLSHDDQCVSGGRHRLEIALDDQWISRPDIHSGAHGSRQARCPSAG